ncbi:hypothetical protein EDC65_0995 [Stella humosa]|uniref:Uncharacterized protein n=1 Tax=Stella humosa TaxID=94 RepID=A0A3N1ME24_9PROT|nr:hypothetical protein [Stella humosa]ROQ01808.1 hypothetical protein EDC65_0995 [Stella humosa]BBK32195.1 hypothetical protein STHU_28290 [Stella humosa]
MQNIIVRETSAAQPHPHHRIRSKAPARKPGQASLPQSQGLTREELRKIVTDLIG